jgi:hypothetical protein
LNGLKLLRNLFPLERRIETAAPSVRTAYAEVLRFWACEADPPRADIVLTALLEDLCAMDAVVLDDDRLGCYPFSARDRGINVHFVEEPRKTVHAMFALAALAIPLLSRRPACVRAPCAICRADVSIDIEASGSVEHSNSNLPGTGVIWRAEALNRQRSCDGLCTAIEFLCRHCAPPADALSFTLPEAAAMANAFFGFQRRLLGDGFRGK